MIYGNLITLELNITVVQLEPTRRARYQYNDTTMLVIFSLRITYEVLMNIIYSTIKDTTFSLRVTYVKDRLKG